MHTSTEQLFSKRSNDDASPAKNLADPESKCSIIHMQGTQYCEETTVHGFQYLTHPGLATKTGWLLVVLLSIIASVYFMVININEFLQV